jgi:hypothetical protein
MEAPDSICLFRNQIGVILDSWYNLDSNAPFEKIEYVRKDAFIEKATSYIQQHWIWNAKMIDDFKNYMKEK